MWKTREALWDRICHSHSASPCQNPVTSDTQTMTTTLFNTTSFINMGIKKNLMLPLSWDNVSCEEKPCLWWMGARMSEGERHTLSFPQFSYTDCLTWEFLKTLKEIEFCSLKILNMFKRSWKDKVNWSREKYTWGKETSWRGESLRAKSRVYGL